MNVEILILGALLVGVCGASIIHQEQEQNPDGSYRYSYETSNGIKVKEERVVENAGTDQEKMVVKGEYSYVGPDGEVYTVEYTADENGFQPSGSHIPTAPPIQLLKKRSLEYPASHTQGASLSRIS
ncbi:hypothetical protein pipiens_003196 [Culex pipiens pipiens]|uniref:Uncharacterized protein n=1 Tax=Culex pipiens pipiens TaxID=38569 RepID=A0ABD1D226_CULPP